MINPDLVLWRSVLANGLFDAARGIDADWLDSDDFAKVCSLAGVEPDAVLRAFDVERFKGRRAMAA